MEVNHTEWPEDHLEARILELEELIGFPHGEAREEQLQHELDCLAFEVGRRTIDQYEDKNE